MARNSPQPIPTKAKGLKCARRKCPSCGSSMWHAYDNYRQVRTLQGVVQLQLQIRRCPHPKCERYHQPYRPEAKGKWALPQQEFGLDVMALIGAWRYQNHRSVPQIHQQLQQRDICISERSVSNLLKRYDELLALKLSKCEALKARLTHQQRVILAIDGLQPDMGHEVLWVIRDCLSGEILLAQTLLSATTDDLASLFKQVKASLSVPVVGVVSDGQQSIRKAVAMALPEVAHGLCHFQYLREAAREIYAADRHAKKELKKRVRGVRAIERSLTKGDDAITEVIEGYCQAVRSALTDDGRPPLDAAGLRLHQRLQAIEQSLEQLEQKGASSSSRQIENEIELPGTQVRRRLSGLLGAISGRIAQAGVLTQALEQFLKVTRSYWPGLFHCYDVEGLPRTNNDLVHLFGQWRHHQRRCTGRKVAPATAVTRGSVQLVAAVATQRRSYSAAELATVNPADCSSCELS